MGLSQYEINLKDRVGKEITYPELYPRMKFVVQNHSWCSNVMDE